MTKGDGFSEKDTKFQIVPFSTDGEYSGLGTSASILASTAATVLERVVDDYNGMSQGQYIQQLVK